MILLLDARPGSRGAAGRRKNRISAEVGELVGCVVGKRVAILRECDVVRKGLDPRSEWTAGEYDESAFVWLNTVLACGCVRCACVVVLCRTGSRFGVIAPDRKSTRLNSSHLGISYAVFCLKK